MQAGLDVGGLHNTHARACVGYGFADRRGDLLFRLGEIPIAGQKREPIPADALRVGLLDNHVALASPTGQPYLSQGTAAPPKAHMVDLVGQADFAAALRDLVWQCDMGFMKPDMGFSLPWVLHVADTGTLQASRSYRITGIAA